jgi:NADPH:quinone reductase-like Zn-dependent oxidoreductase
MRAAVFTRYGPPEVVGITDMDEPVPNENEVLITVQWRVGRCRTLCSPDCKIIWSRSGWRLRCANLEMVSFMARPVAEDLAMIRELISAGSITPVIGRIFSLNDVSDALRYLEGRHARGKVVISLATRRPSHVQQL